MLGGILVLIVTGMLAQVLISRLKATHPFIDAPFLRRLFYYHVFLTAVYYLYSVFNPSDSRNYYRKVINDYRGDNWFDFYGTSTTFIEFLAYPFIRYLGFSYDAMMALFAFFGFIGFAYFYILFKEHVKFKHRLFGVDMLPLMFYLPNLHFWSASLGKGAVIFPAIAIFFYGVSKANKRIWAIVLGSVIIYHVRPHVMLVILVSCFLALIFSSKGISWFYRAVFIALAGVAFFYIYKDVLTMVGINEDEVFTEGLNLSHRARELSKATSGIDISNYSLGLQLFTFIYRPLFFDAPGVLGLIVSVENVFYLFISLRLLTLKGIRFLLTSPFLVKSAFFSFLTVSIALAQVSGNLGIAIRQKSQVMMLLLFVIICFMEDKQRARHQMRLAEQQRKKRAEELLNRQNETIRD